jgi:tRNA-Thr(GGU) m(6)t(6)A37 methyltransferase TsaA
LRRNRLRHARPDPRRKDVRVPYELRQIGVVRSQLKHRASAPRQGDEGAPDAWIELTSSVAEAIGGIEVGDELFVITWLHEAERDVLRVHPRTDASRPLTGVFATRSPDRPNPLGLHRVTAHQVVPGKLKVGPLEAIDGTPVVDIKPVLCPSPDR